MRVFVSGATGAIGPLVVRELLAAGHDVTGLTTSSEKAKRLEAAGATAVLGDLLDADRLRRLVIEARPDAVVNVATRFPPNPMRTSQIQPANELRERGTQHLVAAAIAAGARRYVSESMIFIYGYGDHEERVSEDAPIGHARSKGLQRIIDAMASSERQVREAAAAGRIEGVSLRFGLFHGVYAPSTHSMVASMRKRMLPMIDHGRAVHSWIDVEDAAVAVVAALERAPSGTVFNVVDDEPVSLADYFGELARVAGAPPPRSIPSWLLRPFADYVAAFGTVRLPVSNAKAKTLLAWAPRQRTYREALARLGADEASPTTSPSPAAA